MAAVFCVQWLSKSVFLTGVRVYVLLVLGSHVMKEAAAVENELLLTEQAVEWGIKTMFGLILGLHVLEAMVLPYADSVGRVRPFKAGRGRSGAGSRCRSGSPDGIRFRCIDQKYHGSRRCDSFGTNCFSSGGKASYTCTVLSAAGAIMQPVCDKRMVSCVIGVSRGHRLLLKIVLYSLLLFVIAIAVTCKAADVAYLSA